MGLRSRAVGSILLGVAVIAAGTGARADSVMTELAPTGSLRVAIAVSPSPSAFFATKDPTTGQPRGVTVDLGVELAQKLGVPAKFVVYANSGELTDASGTGAWDVAFMPVDEERRRKVDFGPDYVRFESTFLVPPGSAIRSIAELDRAGIRVLGIDNTTTIRAAGRALKAAISAVRTVDDAIERIRAGQADALALSRTSLQGLAARLPGARILDGHFHATSVAVAVPKSRAAALAYVGAFIEQAKASGSVRRALDKAGLKDVAVSPPATR